MEWTGMDWNGLEWTGLDWNGMECMYVCIVYTHKVDGLDWIGSDRIGLYQLDLVKLNEIG